MAHLVMAVAVTKIWSCAQNCKTAMGFVSPLGIQLFVQQPQAYRPGSAREQVFEAAADSACDDYHGVFDHMAEGADKMFRRSCDRFANEWRSTIENGIHYRDC